MSLASTLTYITQQVSIYFGIPLLLAGLLGGIFNIIIFLSLQTFRQTSCGFYLTIMSIVNIGQLLTGLLSRIMITGFSIDWTQMSLIYCKIRYFIFQSCALISCTCICLAIIDQYFATCSHQNWQRYSRLKVAQILVMIFSILWILHGIPYLIFFIHFVSPSTGDTVCTISNAIFSRYSSYGFVFTFTSMLPMIITIFFGILVYRNIQQLVYRTVPIVRRELDKQLTNMVLNQVIISFFSVLPYAVTTIVLLNPPDRNDGNLMAILQFILTISIYFYYLNYASPFYIYICVSERFRRQFRYVLFDIHLNRWRQPRLNDNQVTPQS